MDIIRDDAIVQQMLQSNVRKAKMLKSSFIYKR